MLHIILVLVFGVVVCVSAYPNNIPLHILRLPSSVILTFALTIFYNFHIVGISLVAIEISSANGFHFFYPFAFSSLYLHSNEQNVS